MAACPLRGQIALDFVCLFSEKNFLYRKRDRIFLVAIVVDKKIVEKRLKAA